MFHHTETKFQGWRAVAVFDDGRSFPLYVGRSLTHIRAGYEESFSELLDTDEQARVTRVEAQCWRGVADQGRWLLEAVLAVPGQRSKAPRAATNPQPVMLSFPRTPTVESASSEENGRAAMVA
jgi:hypothetical protein